MTPRFLLFRGDSITAGAGARPGRDYVTLAARRLASGCGGGMRAVWVAVPGQTAAAIAARGAVDVDPLHEGGETRSFVVLLAGTNDLGYGASAEAIFAHIAAFCRGRRARGFTVVAATLPPHGAAAVPEEVERQRLALNAALRAGWRDFADALADIGGDKVLGDFARIGDLALFSDRIHPTEAGHAIIAGHVAEALAPLL